MKILVEKERHFIPQTARQLMGFPVEYEWKEVDAELAATMDDRIMADGRPAHAWWAELQDLRHKAPQLEKDRSELNDQFSVLRVAKWAYARDPLSSDVLVRVKFLLDENAPLEDRCSIERESHAK